MARPPDGAQARTQTIRCRVTPAAKAELTALRGRMTESDFIRNLIAAEIKRRAQ